MYQKIRHWHEEDCDDYKRRDGKREKKERDNEIRARRNAKHSRNEESDTQENSNSNSYITTAWN
jgi:hypothetical protein